MNTTTKPFLTRSDAGFTIADGGEEHIFCSTFTEAREVLAHMSAKRLSVSSYLDSFPEEPEEPHESTCWVCDAHHHGRGCPIDSGDGRFCDDLEPY